MIRKLTTALAVTAGLLVLSATPADARPVQDTETYCGPGFHASGARCIPNVRTNGVMRYAL